MAGNYSPDNSKYVDRLFDLAKHIPYALFRSLWKGYKAGEKMDRERLERIVEITKAKKEKKKTKRS